MAMTSGEHSLTKLLDILFCFWYMADHAYCGCHSDYLRVTRSAGECWADMHESSMPLRRGRQGWLPCQLWLRGMMCADLGNAQLLVRDGFQGVGHLKAVAMTLTFCQTQHGQHQIPHPIWLTLDSFLSASPIMAGTVPNPIHLIKVTM